MTPRHAHPRWHDELRLAAEAVLFFVICGLVVLVLGLESVA